MNFLTRLKQILILTLRELKLAATSPLIYVVIGAYLFIEGIFFFNKLLQYELVVLQPFFQLSPYLIILFTLAVSSGMLTKQKGQTEPPYLMPLSEFQIIFSKFAAISIILLITLALSALLPLSIKYNGWGTPDTGLMFSGLLGLWLMGIFFISAGMAVSSFTSSQTVAFLISFQIAFVFIIPQFTASIFPEPVQRIFESVGIIGHLYSFSKGLFIFSDFSYFIIASIFFLFIATYSLKIRKWAKNPPFYFHYAPLFFLLGAVFFWLLSAKVLLRVDLTSQKLHTLDDETVKIVKNLKKNVKIMFFCSSGIPKKLVPFKNDIITILNEYDRLSSRLNVAVLDPDKNVSAAKLAKDYGLTRLEIGRQSRTETRVKRIYFGIAVLQGEKTELIQDTLAGSTLEYELTSRIKRLISPPKELIFTKGHGELPKHPETSVRKGFDYLIKQLKNFKVKFVNPQNGIPEKTEILVLAGPTEMLDSVSLKNIENYLKKGGAALFLVDGMKLRIDRNIKGLARQWTSNETGINKLMKPFNIKLRNDMVLSWTAPRLPSGKHGEITYPLIPIIRITSKFSVFPFTLSSFEVKKSPYVKKIKLFKTSSESWRHEKVYEENRDWPVTKLKGSFTAGMFLTASYPDSNKSFKLYLLGDSDLFRDPSLSAINTHVLFMRHIIDNLLGDHSLDRLRFKGRGTEKLKLNKGILSPEHLKIVAVILPVLLIILFGTGYNLIRKYRSKKS